MPQAGTELSAEDRRPSARPRRSAAKRRDEKAFDGYEDCGCVGRWETEGGSVVGEDAVEEDRNGPAAG